MWPLFSACLIHFLENATAHFLPGPRSAAPQLSPGHSPLFFCVLLQAPTPTKMQLPTSKHNLKAKTAHPTKKFIVT